MAALDRKWWTLIAVCTATFMLLLDITVVNVALPDIQRSLNSSFSDLQWVVDAYSLTLAAFLLTAGVVGDIYGRRNVFAGGLVIFSLASLLCGLSTTPLMLNLCRGLQGVGGAVMFATSLALIANAFVGRDRGTAFGIYGAVIGGAVAIGPLIGGAITSAWGWRWIFFVNVPIGVLAVFITFTQIARSKDPQPHRVDWIGFVTFSGSLFTLVFALVRGNDLGWSSASIVALLVSSGVLMVAFFLNEMWTREPMLDLGLFRIPAFVGVSVVAFTIAASIFAMFLYLTLYIQDDLGFSPLAAGIKFLPLTLLAFAVAPLSGRLLVRVQSRYLLGVGMLLITGGLLAMSRTTPTSAWTVLLPGFILCGAGIGTVNPALANGAIAVVQPHHSGMASGANNTFRQVGIATGIAVLGAVFQSQIIAHTTTALDKTASGVEVLRHGGSALHGALSAGQVQQAAQHIPFAGARAALTSAYHVGFSTTLNHLMIIGAIVAFVGAVAAVALVRQRDFVVPGSPGPPPPSAEGGAPPREGDAVPAVHA
ncbi:MAG TPA: MFS transporter [Acidimicrobiales bacterium]|jgi:EmrB/QacA subfamily drug resistance transporter|nr:MFS transporter [Acidimicrobiales bacterium]